MPQVFSMVSQLLLTLGILKLDDEVSEWWNYIQPITVQETESVCCAYWHKYCTDFGIGMSIVNSVTQQKAYNKSKDGIE